MPRRSITDAIIEHHSISQSTFITPGDDDPVRAIDVLGRFAAIYRLAVDEHGAWYDDCEIAVKTSDGWRETNSGGGHGFGWRTPWRPASEGWNGCPLAIMGSFAGELPETDEGDDMVLVLGRYGFATDRVAAIKVTQGTGTRIVDVTSPAGAYVVITIGTDHVELQGLDNHRLPIGPPLIDRHRSPRAPSLRIGQRKRIRFRFRLRLDARLSCRLPGHRRPPDSAP